MEHPVFRKIAEAPKPDFGGILSKSFELFKHVWTDGLMHGLISMAFVIPFIVLTYLPFIPAFLEMLNADHSYGHHYEPFAGYGYVAIGAYIVFVLIMTLILQVVVFAINAHFYSVLKKADTGQPEDVGGYFVFLKGNFLKIFMLNLATLGIALLAIILCYLPIFYVMVPLQLFAAMFTFNQDLSVSEIIKASFKLGNRFWLIIFGLIILSSVIAQLGILLCVVGVIVTAYFVHIPMYFIYKDTIGFNDAVSS